MKNVPEPDRVAVELTEELYALTVYLHATAHRDYLDAIKREELTLSELRLLERIRSGLHPTIREAGSLLHLSIQGASRCVDGLARRGLIDRDQDVDDYRSKRIRITDRGTSALLRLHAAQIEPIATFAVDLTADERDELLDALQPLRDRLAPYRPQPIPA